MIALVRRGPGPRTLAFAAGAISTAVEVLLPRLVAPEVGTTVPVWTASIAVVLAGLSFGAALGGLAADRRPRLPVAALALVLSAPAIAFLPALARATAAATESLPLAARALMASAASTLLPSILLGAVWPAAVRAAVSRSSDPAPTLGFLSAAAAAGGLAGILVTSHLLVPFARTSVSLAWTSAVAAIVGAWGLLSGSPVSDRGTSRAEAVRGPLATSVRERRAGVVPLGLLPASALSAVVGAVILVSEVLAARTIAIQAGSGLPTWAAVLAVVLVGLAAGGALGGRIAASNAPERGVVLCLAASAVWTVASPWLSTVSSAVLSGTGGFDARVATAVALRWIPAFVLLGAVPPVLARLVLAAPERDGFRVGIVSATGTAGCLAGVLLAGPFLLPALGLDRVHAAVASALALSAAALAVSARAAPRGAALVLVSTAILAALPSPLSPQSGDFLVLDGEYARVRVDESPDSPRAARRLWIDDRVHGIEDPSDPTWQGFGYVGVVLAVVERVVPPDASPRILFVGGGSYSVPRAVLAARPKARIDVVELDPAVTRAAREALGLGADPGFAIVHEDARTFVRRAAGNRERNAAGHGPYDVVFADAFADVSIPWHLTTVEFDRETKAVMAPGGVWIGNLIDVFDSGRLLSAMRTTLREAFSRVRVLGATRDDRRERNFLLVASDRDLDLGLLSRPDPEDSSRRIPLVRYGEDEIAALERRTGAVVLTDDFAPVENLVSPVRDARTTR